MHKTTGSKLCLSKEDKDPFACLGLMTDFNGTDVTQNQTHAKPSCLNCVDRTMRTHGWESSSNSDNEHTVTPLRMDVLNQMANHTDGPKEGMEEHASPQARMKFSCGTLLGEMMFACISCRLDTGCAITLMSKCGLNPTEFHHSCLKSTATMA